MGCPYFKEEHVGICDASRSPYVPNIEEMECYCFTEAYHACEIFRGQRLHEESAWLLRNSAGMRCGQNVKVDRRATSELVKQS